MLGEMNEIQIFFLGSDEKMHVTGKQGASHIIDRHLLVINLHPVFTHQQCNFKPNSRKTQLQQQRSPPDEQKKLC